MYIMKEEGLYQNKVTVSPLPSITVKWPFRKRVLVKIDLFTVYDAILACSWLGGKHGYDYSECNGVTAVSCGPKSHTFTVILAVFAPSQDGAINREKVYF